MAFVSRVNPRLAMNAARMVAGVRSLYILRAFLVILHSYSSTAAMTTGRAARSLGVAAGLAMAGVAAAGVATVTSEDSILTQLQVQCNVILVSFART
jgi:hypothetical protein